MNERDWLAGTNPDRMWHHLNSPRRRPDERHLRLLRAALCRLAWERLSAEPMMAGFREVASVVEDRSAVAVDFWRAWLAPILAEAENTERGFAQAYSEAHRLTQGATTPGQARRRQADMYHAKAAHCAATARHFALQVLDGGLGGEEHSPLPLLLYYFRATGYQSAQAEQARELARHCGDHANDDAPSFLRRLMEIQRRSPGPGHIADPDMAHIFHDILGNPFRPVAFDPRWRTEDVVGLAHGIYEDRAFERMPLLADALMDAGCDAEAVLSHCREPGPHYRGCWVVDAVLRHEQPAG